MAVPSPKYPLPRPALSRRAQLQIVAALAIAVIVVLGLVQLGRFLAQGRAVPPPPPPPPGTFRPTPEQWSSLALAPVKAVHFDDAVEEEGKVAEDEDASTPVFSPFSGRVTRVFARAGDSVARGAPLFAVEASELVQAENDLIAAAGTLSTSRAQLDLARTNATRQERLLEARGGSVKDLEQSKVDLASAQAGFQSATAALEAVRDRLRILGRGDAEIDALEKPGAARANPEAIVRAPIAGWVTQRALGVGQNIVSASAGASAPVFTIGQLARVWLLAYVPEADAPAMRTGEPVEASALALPGRLFRGHLDFVAPGIDPNTHRLFVHAEIENPDLALRPEMFAEIRILTGPGRTAPAVPVESVIYEGSEARVWAVGPDRSLGLREIRAGRTQGGLVEVLSGLSAGQSVITSGSLFIDRAAKAE